jgi:RNA ligase
MLGARYNTGKYLSRDWVICMGEKYKWEVVKSVSSEHSTLTELAQTVNGWSGDKEGVVVTFDNGFRVKIKSADYCMKHKAVDGLKFEKDVVSIILSGGLDDVIPIVDDNTKDRLIAFRESVLNSISEQDAIIQTLFDNATSKEDRKAFAEYTKFYPLYAKFLFNKLDNRPADVVKYVLSKCGTQANLESVRYLIGKSYNNF